MFHQKIVKLKRYSYNNKYWYFTNFLTCHSFAIATVVENDSNCLIWIFVVKKQKFHVFDSKIKMWLFWRFSIHSVVFWASGVLILSEKKSADVIITYPICTTKQSFVHLHIEEVKQLKLQLKVENFLIKKQKFFF